MHGNHEPIRNDVIPVSVKKSIPAENNRHCNTSFQSTKSGAGLQFLLLGCRARARRKKTHYFS